MRIATRRSALALAQAQAVAELIGPGAQLVPMQSDGDVHSARAGAQDKSRWVSTLERALGAGEADLAVHSAKDLPGEQIEGLELLGSPPRAAAGDVLCGAASLSELPDGARVGTSSLRRAAQLRAAREDIEVVELHGNVDTRLRRLREGDAALHAIVLAQAGLERLGLDPQPRAALDDARFVPAPGQGALALQARSGDERARVAVAAISDPGTFACLRAERALASALGASCNTPLGAHARVSDEQRLTLLAWVGLPDGATWIADSLDGELALPERLGAEVAERLRAVGAAELIERAELEAGVER